MRAKIPAILWAPLGHYPVKWSPTLIKDRSAYGMVDFKDRVITLDSTMHDDQKLRVFFHEMAHVVLYESGVGNHLNTKQEESICDAFGTFLASMQRAGCLTIKAPA